MLLTNSNGEYGDGSRNKTPHIVGHIHRPPLVAHALQLYAQVLVRNKKGGKPREHVYCTAGRGEIQGSVGVISCRDAACRVSGSGTNRWLLELKFLRPGPRRGKPRLYGRLFLSHCFYFTGT